MEIIFQGLHNPDEAAESLGAVLKLFQQRYQISRFREMHLSVTLVDQGGADVELVDSETEQAYRCFEVHREGQELPMGRGRPLLKLIVDNT